MSTLFSYFDGSLEDFLDYIKEIKDNHLVKVRLASVESFCHVLDNEDCLYTYVEEIRKGRRELAGVTFYKRKRKLTGANS